jgi:hypothetical protein
MFAIRSNQPFYDTTKQPPPGVKNSSSVADPKRLLNNESFPFANGGDLNVNRRENTSLFQRISYIKNKKLAGKAAIIASCIMLVISLACLCQFNNSTAAPPSSQKPVFTITIPPGYNPQTPTSSPTSPAGTFNIFEIYKRVSERLLNFPVRSLDDYGFAQLPK